MVNWHEIRKAYVTDETASYRKLAAKFGVGVATIAKRAKEEDWIGQREQINNKTITKSIESISDRRAENMARVMDITDKLLGKLEQAVEELDVQLARSVVKTKEIEYNHERRPDKPTREVVTEVETITDIRTIVDRGGLKAIASALRDIKEIQMLRSDLDRQEQEARIRSLNRQADKDDNAVGKIEVVFTAGEDEWNE